MGLSLHYLGYSITVHLCWCPDWHQGEAPLNPAHSSALLSRSLTHTHTHRITYSLCAFTIFIKSCSQLSPMRVNDAKASIFHQCLSLEYELHVINNKQNKHLFEPHKCPAQRFKMFITPNISLGVNRH